LKNKKEKKGKGATHKYFFGLKKHNNKGIEYYPLKQLKLSDWENYNPEWGFMKK
jgi:hypothetical protein